MGGLQGVPLGIVNVLQNVVAIGRIYYYYLFIYFTTKTNIVAFEYHLCRSRIDRTDIIKDLEVFLIQNFIFTYICTMCFRKL